MEIFNSPFKTTQSWSSQGAVLLYGLGDPTQATDGAFTEANTNDDATLSDDAAGMAPIPLFVQGISLTYTQRATPVFPLNTDSTGGASKINIKGAPQGVLQIQSIYSPKAGHIDRFLRLAARQCVGPTNQLIVTIRPFGNINCYSDESVTYDDVFRLAGVELESLGLNIQAGEVTLVNMPLSFTFTSLSKELVEHKVTAAELSEISGAES